MSNSSFMYMYIYVYTSYEIHLYREKRIAEMKELAAKEKFGCVRDISASDYVEQVNNAGKDVWVVLHLYKSQ